MGIQTVGSIFIKLLIIYHLELLLIVRSCVYMVECRQICLQLIKWDY